MMTKVQKHNGPRQRLAEILRSKGFEVKLVSVVNKGYDLLINGVLRVAIRVAHPRLRRHHVTVRNRRYTYQYRSWHFNFHRHGKLDLSKPYADVIVCFGVRARRQSEDRVFFIPWGKISGKTFSLLEGRKAYGGQHAGHQDNLFPFSQKAA